MLRNLFILVVFAVASAALAVAYQNDPQRLERFLQPSSVEVAPESLPRTEQKPALQPLGRKVLLQPDARGHFLAAFRINGRPADGMIDTGATLVALTASTARRAGIALSPADFRAEVDTANGRTRAAVVRLDRLEIGKIALEGVEAMVLDDKALGTNLIGMSFLKRLGKYQVENGALLLVQ
ncbi:MAG TPA: TIGR02281 family clan AA aspartic protease [Mesorhizobium sp.]|nr:TIGR02281 family clan AA aspartic protease [Mesorhizobium sp.]